VSNKMTGWGGIGYQPQRSPGCIETPAAPPRNPSGDPLTITERILLHEMRYIASISTGQVQRVAAAAVSRAVAAHDTKGEKP